MAQKSFEEKVNGHLFGRASREFEHKLHEILKMDGMTDAQKCAIEAENANAHAITSLMNNKHF